MRGVRGRYGVMFLGYECLEERMECEKEKKGLKGAKAKGKAT